MPTGTAGWRGSADWHREHNPGAPENAPESLEGHRPDPEAGKRDLRASGDIVTLLAVGGQGNPAGMDAGLDGRWGFGGFPGIGQPCPRRGRQEAVGDPFIRPRPFVRNQAGVPCFQQDESGVTRGRFLHSQYPWGRTSLTNRWFFGIAKQWFQVLPCQHP